MRRLLSEVTPGTVIIRTPTLEPRDDSSRLHRFIISCFHTLLSIPDLSNLWLPWAVSAAIQEIRQRPIKVIYATGHPFSSHILAAVLKAGSRLPIVLDYRDEWTLDPVRKAQQSTHRAWFHFVERWQQRWVVRKADRVVLVTDSARRAFIHEYGQS